MQLFFHFLKLQFFNTGMLLRPFFEATAFEKVEKNESPKIQYIFSPRNFGNLITAQTSQAWSPIHGFLFLSFFFLK